MRSENHNALRKALAQGLLSNLQCKFNGSHHLQISNLLDCFVGSISSPEWGTLCARLNLVFKSIVGDGIGQ